MLAPMAGITDSPFRIMCLEGGAGLVMAEMVSAAALKFGNRRTEGMLRLERDEHPVSVQIFGSDETAIEKASKMAEKAGADIIDINAGCPVKKILRSGSGALLMKNEKLLARLVARAVSSVKIPVTVKIRSAWKKGVTVSPGLARIIENEGAAAVTVHARPVEAGHSGPVDVNALSETAAAVKIPVIGNGGVLSGKNALEILKAGCAGVMIGRAAIGNPLIFKDIEAQLGGLPEREPDTAGRVRLFLRLIDMNAARYGETAGITRARKVVGFWLKGFPGCSGLRACFMKAETVKEVNSILLEYTTGE